MGTAASSISSHTGSPYTPKSTSTSDRTTGAHRGARARGALARLTRPLTAARAHHVHRACQRRCPRPGSRRGCEAAHIVQLLRAHAIITVTRTYGMKIEWAHAPLCTRRRCSVTNRIHSMQWERRRAQSYHLARACRGACHRRQIGGARCSCTRHDRRSAPSTGTGAWARPVLALGLQPGP